MSSETTRIFFVCYPLIILMVGLRHFLKKKMAREKRLSMLAISSVLTTIFEGFVSLVLFYTEGDQVTLPVYIAMGGVFIVSAVVGLFALLRLGGEYQQQREYWEFRNICVVRKFDSGVEIHHIKDGGLTPKQNIITRLPDGMDVYSTMGLFELHGHCDLTITLKLEPGAAESILTTLVHRIEKGEKFEHGQFVDGLAPSVVRFMQDTPDDKESPLRIIFPDANGYWPGDKNCDPVIAQQTLPGHQIWSFHKIDNREEEN